MLRNWGAGADARSRGGQALAGCPAGSRLLQCGGRAWAGGQAGRRRLLQQQYSSSAGSCAGGKKKLFRALGATTHVLLPHLHCSEHPEILLAAGGRRAGRAVGGVRRRPRSSHRGEEQLAFLPPLWAQPAWSRCP